MRNFYLSGGGASPSQAVNIQYNPELLGSVFQCVEQTKELPNFFNVDYITTGDTLKLSKLLNDNRNNTDAELLMLTLQAEIDFMWNPRLSGICNTTQRATKCVQIDPTDPDSVYTEPQAILFLILILQAALVFVPCICGCVRNCRKDAARKRAKKREAKLLRSSLSDSSFGAHDDDYDGEAAITDLSDKGAGGLVAAAHAKDDGPSERRMLDLDTDSNEINFTSNPSRTSNAQINPLLSGQDDTEGARRNDWHSNTTTGGWA